MICKILKLQTTLEESGLDRTSTLTLENANPNAANSSDNFIDLVSNEVILNLSIKVDNLKFFNISN